MAKSVKSSARINFWIMYLSVFGGIALNIYSGTPAVPEYEYFEIPCDDSSVVDTVFANDVTTEVIAETKVVTHVHLTCYQPVEAQCDADPLTTADGSHIDLHKLKSGYIKWVAISPDLLWLIPMGSTVRIISEKTGKVYGEYQVRDKMHPRLNHCMDILIHPDSDERISEKNVRVEVL